MNIKYLKNESKKALKNNYWHIVAVIFFMSIMIGSISFSGIKYNHIPVVNTINYDITKETLESISNTKFNFLSYKPTKGILANIFNNITSSGSFIFGMLNSFNQLIFHERIWASFIILLGAVLTFLYWLFIRNVLLVGEARFFLENMNHKKTNFKRILLPFKIKKIKNITFTMMIKTLLEWFWCITIFGGIVKHYAYYLVPYIISENPEIKPKDAIRLSEDMMRNHKLELFKLDLSFILWNIVDLFCFNLLNIIFISPYKKCCIAKFYSYLRVLAKKNNVHNSNLLCDEYLYQQCDIYPKEKFLYEERQKKSWINIDYNKNYTLTSIILMFFASSSIGWIWETLFHLFRFGTFVNRGALHGPWLPIYGWGAIVLLIILKRVRNKPLVTFVLAMIICGLIEYGTGWYLETLKNARWWDYDGYFLNIHGRICLEGLITFGIGGCAFIYYIAPLLDSILSKINNHIKIILCIILSLLYISDQLYSNKHPNKGIGVNQNLMIHNIKNVNIYN